VAVWARIGYHVGWSGPIRQRLGRIPLGPKGSNGTRSSERYGIPGHCFDFALQLHGSLGVEVSYQVIARKWRPQTFAELVGQGHVAQTLLNGLKSGRLAHALLLTGPRGTGKTSTARILAKSIRCPNAKDFVPCNTCAECNDIAQGRALNVMEIDGASHNGVDAIRELRDTIGFMPSTGRFKVYIIDEVHMLSTSAFNALLKTLEEPPDHIVFVLATTEVQKIPNTILSRCQRLDFRRIPAREVVARLKSICDQETVTIDDGSLWLIARQSEGSMRDSQSLLDQVITFSNGHVTAESTAQALGLSDRNLLLDVLRVLVQRDEGSIVDMVQRTYQAGVDAKVFVQDLLQEIRHLLLVKMGLNSSHQLLDLPDSEVEFLKSISRDLSVEDVHLLFDMALKGAQDVVKAFDPQLVLEMLLFRMAAAPRIEPLFEGAGDGASARGSTTPTEASSPAGRGGKPAPLRMQSAETSTGIAKPSLRAVNGGGSASQSPNHHVVKNADLPTDNENPEISSNQVGGAIGPLSATAQNTVAPEALTQVNMNAKASNPQAPAHAPMAQVRTAGFIDKNLPLDERWYQFAVKANTHSPFLGAKLSHLRALASDENAKVLRVGISQAHKFLFDQMNSEVNKKQINELLQQHWETGFRIEFQLGDTEVATKSPQEIAEQMRQKKQSQVRSQVENHPVIQGIQNAMKAEIRTIKESP
jgi:DNA polymerase-3 subunit gamma/tau